MKVLSIGPDKDLLKVGSVSYLRHQQYATELDELHAIVFARQPCVLEHITIAPNAWSYPTCSQSTLDLLIDAYRIGRRLLSAPGEWVISAQDPFESGLVAYALSRATGAPFLVQEHGDFFSAPYWRRESLLNRCRAIVGRFLIRRADHVRVVSERIARTCVSLGVPRDRITVAPVWVDLQPFVLGEPDRTLTALRPHGGCLVVTMARLVPQKNLPLLLDAWQRIEQLATVPARLVIIGDGVELSALEARIAEAGGSMVTLLPWTERPAAVLQAADVYVLSSNYEGFGRVCIEALAAGTPLVMTNVGCAGDLVRDGVNGRVVPVGNPVALANALTELIERRDLRTAYSAAGKKAVAAYATKEQLQALYLESLRAARMHAAARSRASS